jgi:hypothetical protein
MGKCVNHPDRETSFLCSKYNIYMCEECLKCRDPDIYCKFRSACPVWFMTRRKKGLDADEKIAAAEESRKYEVVFAPDGRKVKVPEGTTLLNAALVWRMST